MLEVEPSTLATYRTLATRHTVARSNTARVALAFGALLVVLHCEPVSGLLGVARSGWPGRDHLTEVVPTLRQRTRREDHGEQ